MKRDSREVARTVLQPKTATQDDVASAVRVPVSMWRVGTVGISADRGGERGERLRRWEWGFARRRELPKRRLL